MLDGGGPHSRLCSTEEPWSRTSGYPKLECFSIWGWLWGLKNLITLQDCKSFWPKWRGTLRDPVLGSRYRATLYEDLCRRVVFTEELCTPMSCCFYCFCSLWDSSRVGRMFLRRNFVRTSFGFSMVWLHMDTRSGPKFDVSETHWPISYFLWNLLYLTI